MHVSWAGILNRWEYQSKSITIHTVEYTISRNQGNEQPTAAFFDSQDLFRSDDCQRLRTTETDPRIRSLTFSTLGKRVRRY